jgi:ABC-type bacteriocin/lantibiotic exporter with double-glycine peptidase domain
LVYLQGRLDTHAMEGFSRHLLRLPLRFFQERSAGDIVMRLTSIATLREMLTTQTAGALIDAAMTLSYLAIIFLESAVLGCDCGDPDMIRGPVCLGPGDFQL